MTWRVNPMDFFAHQDLARRQTKRLVVLFILAVIAIVVAVDFASAVAYLWLSPKHQAMFRHGFMAAVPSKVWILVTIATLLVIIFGTTVKLFEIAQGGSAVAEMVGARLVNRNTKDPAEKRYLNIVEEMAIASGTSVPLAYLMDQEMSINAFAAGYSPNEAVVAISQGALTALSREELQGVIGHEFSHILNGDMRLNIHLIGLLNGIVFIGSFGLFVLRNSGRIADSESGAKVALPLFLFGLMIAIIGYVGIFFSRLIKSGVSRQREFLADASSVQFTRNPEGIGKALDKIRRGVSLITNRHAEQLSHMFFSQAFNTYLTSWFATHPPIEDRLERIGYVAEKMERAQAGVAPVSGEQDLYQFGSVAGFAGNAADKGVIQTTPQAVVAAVGNPSPAHVSLATNLLKSIPEFLRDAVGDPEQAKAAMYALFLDTDSTSRAKQLQLLTAAGEEQLVEKVEMFAEAIQTLGNKIRLPLIDLATPSLKGLIQEQRDAFLAAIEKLIASDNKVTLDEFTLRTILNRRLDANAARLHKPRYSRLDELKDEILSLISLVAYAGNGEGAKSDEAFQRGWKKLELDDNPMLSIKRLNLNQVDQALEKLNLLMPLKKPLLIKACLETVLADGKTTPNEVELMRAICTALDCPLPPLLAKE